MVQIGEDVYARRNHRLTQIMQLPMQDRRRAVYAFLRGDTPFCPPAGRIQQRPPWNPFASLPGDLRATFQRAPLHGQDWSTRGGKRHGTSPRTGSSGGETGATDWSVRGNGENTRKRRPGFKHPGRHEARQ